MSMELKWKLLAGSALETLDTLLEEMVCTHPSEPDCLDIEDLTDRCPRCYAKAWHDDLMVTYRVLSYKENQTDELDEMG